jgi:thioredoxin reductase
LSLAAFLRSRGVDFRIFGSPMETWRTQMPVGMSLKSEGFASNLYDPDGVFTLERYCADHGIAYGDVGVPVTLATFVAYGTAFQERFVPDLDQRKVAGLTPNGDGFELRLEDGALVAARKVVVAVGISHFSYVPDELAHLPPDFVSHSSQHTDLQHFNGRHVAVLGAGASAGDLAGLLTLAGAKVELVARGGEVQFNPPPELERSLWQRVRYPRSGLGLGPRLLFYSNCPEIIHRIPAPWRYGLTRTHIPAPCWFTRELVVGKVPFHLGVSLERAEIRDGQVVLHLSGQGRAPEELAVDHLISATGFRVNLQRVGFLSESLRARIPCNDNGMPQLSPHFESSVPGLYFVGAAAMDSFGPLLRFAYGARFAATNLSAHFANLGLTGARRATPRTRDTV